MAIPERMIPVKVSSKKIRELAQKAKEILAAIDSGSSRNLFLFVLMFCILFIVPLLALYFCISKKHNKLQT